MGIYTKHHCDQMKATLKSKIKEIEELKMSLGARERAVVDLERGIRALEALGDD